MAQRRLLPVIADSLKSKQAAEALGYDSVNNLVSGFATHSPPAMQFEQAQRNRLLLASHVPRLCNQTQLSNFSNLRYIQSLLEIQFDL